MQVTQKGRKWRYIPTPLFADSPIPLFVYRPCLIHVGIEQFKVRHPQEQAGYETIDLIAGFDGRIQVHDLFYRNAVPFELGLLAFRFPPENTKLNDFVLQGTVGEKILGVFCSQIRCSLISSSSVRKATNRLANRRFPSARIASESS